MRTKRNADKEMFCEEYEPKRKAGVPPISRTELQERLKRVSGLCYGLLCDIGSMEIETANLRAKVLKFEANAQGITPEALEKRRAREAAANGYEQPQPPLTSAEVKERLKQIAGECYAMNADIKEERNEAAALSEYIAELEAELAERKRVCTENCYTNKKRAFMENGGKIGAKTPQRQKEYAKKYYNRKKQRYHASKAREEAAKDRGQSPW